MTKELEKQIEDLTKSNQSQVKKIEKLEKDSIVFQNSVSKKDSKIKELEGDIEIANKASETLNETYRNSILDQIKKSDSKFEMKDEYTNDYLLAYNNGLTIGYANGINKSEDSIFEGNDKKKSTDKDNIKRLM